MKKKRVACEKVVPHYWHRSTANKPARKSALKAAPAKEYPPGYFTALIAEHNWPKWFVSHALAGTGKVTPAPHRHGGFDRNPLGLPGAAPYTALWEGRGRK